jgi:O-6-methylguanine DNA methyltransferase
MPDMKKSFSEKVLAVVRLIPRDTTLTYKEAARCAGSPRAYRAVGNILNKNHDPKVPCHRVVCSDGGIGGYNKGTKTKIRLLRQERTLHGVDE